MMTERSLMVDSLLFKGVENQTQPPFELVRYAVESAYFFT